MEKKLFTKDFTLVVIGQIISLFGNAAVRFALPLYLLNQTGSSALYGTVMACAFIPTIVLSPVGGMIADRVNKRNIMVTLDFATAGVLLAFLLLQNQMNLVFLITLTLMLLFGIAGAYQPAVQASIPALTARERYMQANAVINIVSSFAALLGPVFGGVLYSVYGLLPILEMGTVCFLLSAGMEIFIRIPYEKQETVGSIRKIMKQDLAESLQFIRREKPVIGEGLIVTCCVNLFFSAVINVGLPYLVTEVLAFAPSAANRLYGYAEGVLAAGGIVGGIGAGILAQKLQIRKAGNLLTAAAVCLFPIGMALFWIESAMAVYLIMTACCFVIMTAATIFSVQIMSFVQAETPQSLVGKVISVCMMVSMCAQPFGNAMYGFLFELFRGREAVVLLAAGAASLVVAAAARKVFSKVTDQGALS
ncbi:MAG: MFS transporter [Lachnospiraceae bacterium]